MNTHYAVLHFSGDPAEEHPDEELRGQGPGLMLIAAGPEDFCWQALADWTKVHPLRMWETAEVVKRDPQMVHDAEPIELYPHCHCGEPVIYGYDGDPTHHRGMCEHCDSVRCDAYPGACKR